MFAKALIIADEILENSEYLRLRQERYASFDSGAGASFEKGEMTLEQLREYAIKNGEPKQISGKQEYYENLINRFL
jgi:xylose isomerase